MPRFNALDHPICFAYPQWIAPSAWIEHIPFAMYVVDLLRPRVFVELGSHYGVSYCAFCQAIAELQLPTRAYAIDTWQGDAHNGFYGSGVLDALSIHQQPRYGGFSRLIQQSFDDALGSFADGSIDLLHIDGYHTYDAVRHDFETWLPKLSERAVVLFHDIDVRKRDFGVWKLWEELTPRYPHFSFDHGYGLGVLAVGAESPRALTELVDADADEAALIQQVFYELGLRLRTHQKRDWQRQELAAQQDQRKLADVVALCCYFDRVARTLTLGEAHFGLRPAARRNTQPEALILCCYGVEVRLADEAGLGLCQRLRDTLPPEFAAPSEPCEVSVAYVVTASVSSGMTAPTDYLISCDSVAVFATAVEEELYWWLRWDIDQAVARRSVQQLFVHAGVVGWRGIGIVIPGAGSIGKSRLVAELVRRGATYYSDTFAVLDDQGRVHPYRNLIGLDIEGYARNFRLVREDEPAEPLPLGLIVDGAYAAGAVWRPAVVRGLLAALPLVEATVRGREQAAQLPQIAAQIAAGAVGLRGPRAEAKQVAALLLDLVDDALVSRALDVAGDNLGRMDGELARVAEFRLRSPDGWTVSPLRRLEAARYVRITDFLAPVEHERLLRFVLSGEHGVWEARVADAELRTHSGEHYNEIWDMFDRRLHTMLPFIREQLDLVWFPVGRIEWQLTAYGRSKASAPRVDTGDPLTKGRRISCIYSFHQLARRFSGGELKLYDTWITPGGNTGAATYTALEPLDNSLVFFPSDAFHEVCPAETDSDAIADSGFALTIRFSEIERPSQDSDLAHHAVDDVSLSALSSPAGGQRALGGAHARRQVAVVVPAHRFPLSADEQIAIRHLRTHLGEFDRYLIGPQIPPGEFADFARAPAPANTYVDRVTYNRLLMSEQFYRAFEDYEYILIYQLDCLVFSNALEAWCRKGYDYVGAPWFERWHQFRSERSEYPEDIVEGFGTVGNGGFSLRKVSAALSVLTSTKQSPYDQLVQELIATPDLGFHEDIFWSFHAPKLVDTFRIPTPRQALEFAFETEPRYCYRENGYRLPFGCHGWPAWERAFWEPFLLK